MWVVIEKKLYLHLSHTITAIANKTYCYVYGLKIIDHSSGSKTFSLPSHNRYNTKLHFLFQPHQVILHDAKKRANGGNI